jgi:hypothetical protein
MAKKVVIDWDEAKEIAAHILNVNANTEDDLGNDAVEDALDDKWGIDIELFREVTQEIFNLVEFGVSPLKQTAFVGISKPGEWMVKKKVDQQFLAGIIEWATEGEEIKEGSNGYLREITKDGKVESEIVIRRPKAK